MSTPPRRFAVPCATCHLPRASHDGKRIIYPSGPHDYQPDERSVEWAAVKLREALDEIIADHDQRLAAGYLGEDRLLKLAAMEAGRQALALADAAGIGSLDSGSLP